MPLKGRFVFQKNVTAIAVFMFNMLFFTTAWAGSVSLDQKFVWSHMVGWHSWDFVNKSYGNYHDVPMARPTGNEVTDYRAEVQAMLDAGIDGITFDIIGGNEYGHQCRSLLEAARGTRLQIANTLCGAFDADPVNQAKKIAGAIESFSKYPNYASVDGKPIFFTFWAYKKPPQYWLTVRQALKDNHGKEIFLAGDPDALWNKKTSVADLSKYAGVFDIFYNYAEYGLSQRQAPGDVFAITAQAASTATRTGKWAAAIAPGYRGAWPLNGRNDYYITFKGLDRFWDAWQAAVNNDAPWIHLANWNDLDETPLQPMMFQFHSYGLINRYWASVWRGEPILADTPQVLFAYQREQMIGTMQRIEMVNLPMAGAKTITVQGQLLDMQGNVAGQLAVKTFAADKPARDEWFVDTSAYGATPVLVPRITVNVDGKTQQRDLPMMRLRTGWIENQVVLRVPMQEMAVGSAKLEMTDVGSNMLRAVVQIDTPLSVRRATLWCDDRPIGSLDVSSDALPTFALRWQWRKDHRQQITVENGSFVRSFQHGPHAASFVCDATSMAGSLNRYDYMAANVAGQADTVLNIAINDNVPQRVTLQQVRQGIVELRDSGNILMAELSLSPYDPLAALPRIVKCSQGKLFGTFPMAYPSQGKLFYVRLETHDGQTFFSNCVTPYADDAIRIESTVLKTTTTLDNGTLGALPAIAEVPIDVKLHPAMVQQCRWDLAYPGTTLPDTMGNVPMYLGSAGVYYKNDAARTPQRITLPDGMPGLAFDGVDDVAELAVRQQPHGAFTLSLRLRVEQVTGKEQVIWGSQSEACVPLLMLDEQGHLLAGRQTHDKEANVLARSPQPVPVGQWLNVTVTFDQTHARLSINNQHIAQAEGRVYRRYGNTRTYLGGYKQPFYGQIADVSLSSVPMM